MSIHLQANANELKVSNCIEKCHTFTFEETYVGLCSFSWFSFFRNSVEIILPNQHTGGMLLSQGSLDGLSSVARSQRFVIIDFYYLRSKRNVFLNFNVPQNEVGSFFSTGGMKPHSRKGRKRYLAKVLFSLFRVILIQRSTPFLWNPHFSIYLSD